MSFRAVVLTSALLAVLVPIGLQAGEAEVPAPGCAPVADAISSEATPQILTSSTVTRTLLDIPEPVAQCTYTCGPLGLCPDIRDLPPGQCVSGCCVYETSCSSTCAFDSDCGPLASCWSGCCYSWTH